MAVGPGRFERVDGEMEPGVLGGGDVHGHPAGQGDGLGVGGPVGRRDEHLVTGVAQGGEGLVDGLLGAVGHEHLGGRDLVARVAPGLGRHRLLQGGQAAGGRVVVVGRDPAGLDGRLHDVGRGGEVGLAGAEADDVLARGPQRLGLGVDGQGGRRGDGGDPGRDPPPGGRRRRPRGWFRGATTWLPCLHTCRAPPDTTDTR